jgi:hypothetical protein
MPPRLKWFVGREAIRTFTVMAWKTCRRFRLLPTGANWQPAFAAYELTSDGSHFAARAIHVLTLENGLIQRRYLFHRQARACFPLLGFRSDFQIPRFGERARSRTKNLPIFPYNMPVYPGALRFADNPRTQPKVWETASFLGC